MTDILARITLPVGTKSVLCAVSGGADSVCMLHALLAYAKGRDIRVCAAHYDHGIRGEESVRDADFVAALCERLGVELVTERGDVPRYARENRLGIEEAARQARYDFFERAANTLDCDIIATAHSADDNAETMIFNLARGTGAKGLCGIPARRGRYVRPLLGITRAEIEQYLDENGLDHVEDSTNATDDYSRNLIRHAVMPHLRAINPALADSCARTAELLRRDEDYFDLVVQSFLQKSFDGVSVGLKDFEALHEAVASRVVRALWPKSLSSAHVDAVLALRGGRELAYADLPGGRVRRECGRLYFREVETAPREIIPRELIPGQTLDVPEAGVRVRTYFAVENGEINGLFKTYRLKCESIYGSLFCTGRQPGDKLAPVGRGCTKTLKSLFAEKHISVNERAAALIIRDGRGVALVDKIGADARFAAEPGDRILCVEFEKI